MSNATLTNSKLRAENKARRNHRSQNHFLAEVNDELRAIGFHLRESGRHLRLAISAEVPAHNPIEYLSLVPPAPPVTLTLVTGGYDDNRPPAPTPRLHVIEEAA